MAKLAFLGLGVMGGPMAGHLAKAGHAVTVYNRTAAKAEAWVAAHGGAWAATPAQAAEGADFVMACVGNDDDLRSICTGPDGAFAGMSKGAVFVDHTTVSARVTREMNEAAAALGLGFVDAPVSGGQAGAENGGAVHHVRGRCRPICPRRTHHGRLCPRVPPHGRQRRGAGGQDDEPDLHRRTGSGPVRSPAFR